MRCSVQVRFSLIPCNCRIKHLSHPSHRYKININAQQYNLTGVCILYTHMNLVVVEGGPKGIKAYKKLMLRRIKWSDSSDNEDKDTDDRESGLKNSVECALVWEGVVTCNSFKYFKTKSFPTDLSCRQFLEELNVAHYWDTAKNFTIE